MLTLLLVLCFPLLLFVGYTPLYLLSGRDRRARGPEGLALYLALLSIPLAAVVRHVGVPYLLTLFDAPLAVPWLVVGVGVGLLLAAFQALTLPLASGEAPVWPGPPGCGGFALVMLPVAYIVAAEEIIWRGYLAVLLGDELHPAGGLAFSSAAFALHHWPFGGRHLAFAFAAGVVWGALLHLEGGLCGAVASHLTYDAFAWAWMRRATSASSSERPGSSRGPGSPRAGA